MNKNKFIKKLIAFNTSLEHYMESEDDANFVLTEKEYNELEHCISMLSDIQGNNW